ncbi:PAS domain-containing protein cky-1 isoform X2 [Parasteatoda tepidariorum]|uniref:PAS domain-containing protein cky-1 isoform X2 n=1 Tax=Parasteatoda tepidariorum TaxID=114398 RepID=UPI001C719A7E|nr:neuronal PAS domain-containing protein 4 isoform X1 [Parasteatoda tepidariorum]
MKVKQRIFGKYNVCYFDANKSTKGASKLRRDLINAEIANLRDLLPLPSSTRQRLSQLQLMALICVYVRKANYFQHVFRKHELPQDNMIPHFGFSKALSGFLMMMTQNGKLLYISDNAAEYLGHSMEDLLIHGDSVYDIIEKQDHQAIQTELMRSSNPLNMMNDTRMFLCRMNVSRNARRQMRFGDQKVVLIEGHFVSFLPLCSRNEPVFLATCTPVAMPETRECVVQGSTTVFTTIHSMDMKFLHIDRIGEFHLGYTKASLQGISWYELVHWDHLREAQSKHRLITQSEQERSCIILLRLQNSSGRWLWVHVVLQIKDSTDTTQQSVIVCTNQILSDKEAAVMQANSWLYQYYSLHSKMHYGLAYEAHPSRLPTYYSAMMPYHPSPTEAAVPPSPYHLHPPPLNGSSTTQPQPTAPPTVLQYGGVPYTSLPAESEQARWPASVKRPASPTSSSPSKSPPRVTSSSTMPTSSIPNRTSGSYQAATAEVVVPPSAYYGSTQVFAAVSYSHLVSLREKQVDEENVEQSLTPTDTEEVSAMISLSNRPSSYIPIASVLTESNRVLSDTCSTEDYIKRQDDPNCRNHLFCSSPRSTTNRFDFPYVRYGNAYPLVDLDPRKRFSKWEKDIRQGSFWGSPEHHPHHLGPIQGDCFPYSDGSWTKTSFLETNPMYQDLNQEQNFRARLLGYDIPRRDEILRISSENQHSISMDHQQDVYGSGNHARPCLVRPPSNSPSPHSRTSSDC